MTLQYLTHSEQTALRSHRVSNLLSAHFPTFRTGQDHLDIPGLARAMGFSPETVYRAVRQIGEIRMPIARAIVAFSHSEPGAVPLYLSALLPYICHDWQIYGEVPTAEADDPSVPIRLWSDQ